MDEEYLTKLMVEIEHICATLTRIADTLEKSNALYHSEYGDEMEEPEVPSGGPDD